MHQLIITEKPSAAKRIADALADDKVEVKKEGQVSIFNLNHGGNSITVVSAVGHLFTVAEKVKSFKYPSYDIDWAPSYEKNKNADYTKKYANVIKKEAKKADSFVVACDFDIEGEVIGLNVIRYLCKQKDAMRMKFSTLTKPDIIESYDTMSPTIEWGQAKAGETRHFLDWMYGINLSRALTLAVRKNKIYKVMSSGRVQGPALKILADREKEIRAFIPEPYWQVQLLSSKPKLEAWHKEDKIFDQKRADEIIVKTKNQNGEIKDITKKETKQMPPFPFDLTTLQTEGYRNFGYTPKRTLEHAQELYSSGFISYPRTSSQQLTPKIGFKKIIQELMKQSQYGPLGNQLVNKSLKPNNGKKTDPAHPAIYPTGLAPKKVSQYALKIYDLIVKRFFATFSTPATRETLTVKIDVNTEPFVARGTITTVKGWHVFYEPYVKLKEEELPAVKLNETVIVKEINKLDKETQPPRRYTQASIIKELEKRGLGTKATRAQIVQNLIDRDYVEGKTLTVNEIGIRIIETLDKYCPEIVSESLTRSFEDDMELIREEKKGQEKTLDNAKLKLNDILEVFKKNEMELGKSLAESYKDSNKRELGVDPKTKKLIFAKKGRYGPYVQLGEKGDEDIKFASLPKGVTFDKVTFEDSLKYFELPRIIGELDGKPLEVNVGRYGPYVKHDGKFVSIGNEDPYTIEKEKAIELIKNKNSNGNGVLKEFGKIKIKNGKFGPYVTDGKKNVSIKGKKPEDLTEADAKELLKK
jgi:DNA topoisomerase I